MKNKIVFDIKEKNTSSRLMKILFGAFLGVSILATSYYGMKAYTNVKSFDQMTSKEKNNLLEKAHLNPEYADMDLLDFRINTNGNIRSITPLSMYPYTYEEYGMGSVKIEGLFDYCLQEKLPIHGMGGCGRRKGYIVLRNPKFQQLKNMTFSGGIKE